MSGVKKTPAKKHQHDWRLGHYTPYSFDVIGGIGSSAHISETKAKAEFVCECGKFKTVYKDKS